MRSGLALLVILLAGCDGGDARRTPAARPRPDAARPVLVDASGVPDAALADGAASTPDPDALPPSVGLAAYFMTNVFAEPRFESRRLGWIRVGQKFEIGPKLPGDDKCPDGFHALTRSRGFVCQGKGIVVGRYPGTLRHGTQPAKRDALIPYDYGYVRMDGTPLYRRAPSWEQVQEIEYPEEPDAGPGGGAGETGGRGPSPETEVRQPGPETEVRQPGPETEVRQPSAEPEDRGPSAEPEDRGPRGDAGDDDEPEDDEEPDLHGGLVVRYMNEGFILSVDRQLGEWPNLLYRTIRGQWVNARKVHKMRATTFRGTAIPEGQAMPVVFAGGRARARFERNTRGRIVPRGQVAKSFASPVVRELEEQRQRWLELPDGSFLRPAGLTIVRATPPPEGVGPDEKWIDVDVTHQTLVAYEGTRPVYATLVSSGSESRDFATPPGSFRIRSKHVTFTMDGDLEGDGAYSIEDVPYVMYYDLNYALHAAFWHSFFGRQRSHGCVNLSAADAKWLFDWVEPQLPADWYGVWADDEHPGTRVFIRKPED